MEFGRCVLWNYAERVSGAVPKMLDIFESEICAIIIPSERKSLAVFGLLMYNENKGQFSKHS